MAFYLLDVLVFVTVKAEFVHALNQQLRLIRSMRAVAGGAISDGIVGEFRFFQKIVVTIPAQSGRAFHNQFFLFGGVGIMAGEAIAIFHGLMFEFRLGNWIIMAIHAQVPGGLKQEFFDWGLVRRVAAQAIA